MNSLRNLQSNSPSPKKLRRWVEQISRLSGSKPSGLSRLDRVYQTGVSLIELMIGIALGILVSLAVVAVFLGTKRTFGTSSANAAMVDNGRFAAGFLNASLRSAGYIGCASSSKVVNSAPTPYTILSDFGHAVLGFEANTTSPGNALTLVENPVPDAAVGDWSPSLPAGATYAVAGKVIKGSDVLVVHNTTQFAPTTVTAISHAASTFTVNNATGLVVGQLAAISDCTKTDTFQITGVAGTTITHAATGAMTPGNAAAAFVNDFGVGSLITLPGTSVFFIAPGQDGDGALWRADLTFAAGGAYTLAATGEIVPDIENMQIVYGVDTNNDTIPDLYETADNVADFGQVVSVKVAFLAASTTNATTLATVAPVYQLFGVSVTAPKDNKNREVYEVDVALRNNLP